MFDSYAESKVHKFNKWAPPLVMGVFVLHLAFLGGAWAKSQWDIKKLDLPPGQISFAVDTPPPPPPPPPKGGSKPQETKPEVKKVKVDVPVQPTKIEKIDVAVKDDGAGDPDGVEGGVEGGVAGGVVGGVVGGVLGGVPDAPPPEKPQLVTPTAAKANFLSGDQQPQPDNLTAIEMKRSGKSSIVAVAKICIGPSGSVSSSQVMKSSGFPAYDSKIKSAVGNWKYKPFMVNGKASQVCTTIQFIYKPQ